MICTDPFILQDNFEQARREHAGTIRTFSRNCVHQLPGYDLEDVQQELLMLLWKCVQKYDPNRGASFSTLFQGSARNYVIGLVRAANAQKRGRGSIVTLNDEDFAKAAESFRSEGSAEDCYLAWSAHGDRFKREMRISAVA